MNKTLEDHDSEKRSKIYSRKVKGCFDEICENFLLDVVDGDSGL